MRPIRPKRGRQPGGGAIRVKFFMRKCSFVVWSYKMRGAADPAPTVKTCAARGVEYVCGRSVPGEADRGTDRRSAAARRACQDRSVADRASYERLSAEIFDRCDTGMKSTGLAGLSDGHVLWPQPEHAAASGAGEQRRPRGAGDHRAAWAVVEIK